MKDSKKEHRISNLKDMIDNVKEDKTSEASQFDELEEDSELINYLNEDNLDYEELEIDDEFIYHPGDEDSHAIDLEENPIDEDFIIKTPNTEDAENKNEFEEFDDEMAVEISESFDNVINAKVRGRPILAIVSSVLGVILLVISVYIFQSRSGERVIDNVVAGETKFMFVIFVIVGLFLLIYGVYKLFNIKNPFKNITDSIDSIEDNKKSKKEDTDQTHERPSPKAIPKSNIPLDKESYKIGEFDMEDIKNSLKKPTPSKKSEKEEIADEETEDLPPAKEKSPVNEEIEERDLKMEYEKAILQNESIDDIFAEVEDIEDIPIISVDSKEEK